MLNPAEVKQRFDLVEVVSEFTRLKRSGRHFTGLCPFHGEQHPSFCVDPEKQLFYCFGCGAGGDIFNFIMRLYNYSFHEALSFLAQRAGIKEIEKDERLKLLSHLQTLFTKTLSMSEKAKAYLVKRGLSPTADRFGIGLAPRNLLKILVEKNLLTQAKLSGFKSEEFIQIFQGRLTFPFYNRCGDLVGFAARTLDGKGPKYINTEETEFFKKKELLFGYNSVKGNERIYVVEGYFDCILCLANGIPSVAVGSTSLTQHQARLLQRFDRVIIAFDGDQAGRKATLRAFKILVEAGIYPYGIFLPEGEDPDSLLRKGKKKEFLCLEEKDLFRLIISKIEKLPPQSAIAKLNNLAQFLADKNSGLSQFLLQQIKKTFSIKIKNYTRKNLKTERQILRVFLSSPEAAQIVKKRQLLNEIEDPTIRETLKYFCEHRTLPEGHTYMGLLASASIHPPEPELVEKAIRYLERKKALKGAEGSPFCHI